MDCRSARLLLHFTRPKAAELDPAEAQALELHLGQCGECAALARGERHLDDHLGRAMRNVPVPDGLRNQLLARLEVERGDWYRRWFGYIARGAVAAAILLLVGWGALYYYETKKPQLALVEMRQQFNNNTSARQATSVDEVYETKGVSTYAPRFVNYAYLATPPGFDEVPGIRGKLVPRLDFAHGKHRATVYIVSSDKFNLRELPEPLPFDHGYPFNVQVERKPGDTFAYVIFHTGRGYDWLRVPE